MNQKYFHHFRGTLHAGILLSLLVICFAGFAQSEKLDLNNAGLDEIYRLPVPANVAERIYEHVTYQGAFADIFELRKIKGIDQPMFLKLKSLVRIEPDVAKTEREERIENLYYKLDRWEGNEGVDQSLVDLWLEQALEPIDINKIRYQQLLNLQGVTPVDAASIINYRNQVGKIFSTRDLRSAPFLSYYGYRNTRDFVSFEESENHFEFHGHLLTRMDNTPFLTTEAEATNQLGIDPSVLVPNAWLTNKYPNIYTRFLGSVGKNIHFGYSYTHNLNEPFIYKNALGMDIPSGKFYAGIENQKLGPLEVRKLYLGNYSLAFGQGVIMENTDYFQPRKSGFGFRKRFIGLSGDNSRTRQYKLTGAATELAYKNAHLFLFGSFDKRDAILNRTPYLIDGKEEYAMNQLIVLDQRFQYAPVDSSRRKMGLSWRDNVKELLYGLHAAYDVLPATQVGVTYYESAYDRLIRPDLSEIVANEALSAADNSVYNSYGGEVSDGSNPIWNGAKSFRRVYGFDFQTVYQNVSFQGEYAELDKSKGLLKNPYALVLSSYLQYNSFSLLALYRDYQLEFDNPYQRSFSNYQRFKRTIYEDYFYLQDPLYGQLYTNNPQPQAERGYYLYSRYQFNRKMVLSLDYNNWRRVSDDATQHRLVGTLDFRPIFPLRVNLRQKYQGREVANNVSTEYFENFEFRGLLRMRLSRFDELGILYMNATTKFRPRPRFLFPVEPGEDQRYANMAGNIGSPAEAIGGFFTHNFNDLLKVKGFIGYYKGFFWNFEDTQFQVMDSKRGAMRYWFSVYSRINSQLSMRLKYTRDYSKAINYWQTRSTANVPINIKDGKYYTARYYQPGEDFYYLEFNLHF